MAESHGGDSLTSGIFRLDYQSIPEVGDQGPKKLPTQTMPLVLFGEISQNYHRFLLMSPGDSHKKLKNPAMVCGVVPPQHLVHMATASWVNAIWQHLGERVTFRKHLEKLQNVLHRKVGPNHPRHPVIPPHVRCLGGFWGGSSHIFSVSVVCDWMSRSVQVVQLDTLHLHCQWCHGRFAAILSSPTAKVQRDHAWESTGSLNSSKVPWGACGCFRK